MAVIDSYIESNYQSDNTLYANIPGQGQSFTGDGNTLGRALFYLKKSVGSPTGNAVAKIYAHSGTFGTSSIPTGAALATSDNFDVSALTTSMQLITFTFSGANQITLTNGTKYVVTVEYSGGNGSNTVGVGGDATSPTHGGNRAELQSGTWSAFSSDLIFYVYSTGSSPSLSISLSPSITPSASPSITPSASPSVSISLSPSLSPSPSPAPPEFFGLKISKPGVNVLTNSDIDKLIFSSDYGTLKYFQKSTASIQIVGTGVGGDWAGTTTIDHNLGYYPFVEVFVRVYIGAPSGNYEYVPFAGAGASVFYSASYKITTTQIRLYAEFIGVSSSTWNFDFLVFIYKNNLNL